MSEPIYDINDDVKRDVLHATDLVTLIGGATGLKKVGASWKGLCPFHSEKTPSFYVHPEKGFYYCFGCGAKGDAISFVKETERVDFAEAVAYLARQAGISLPLRKRGTRAERGKETRSTEAVAAAAKLFREQLPRHAPAKALLERRGLSLERAVELGFGAAPDSWDTLKNALSPIFPEEVLLEAGLLQKHPESGRLYDRFRNRLTLEIRDSRGEVLGFGARAFGDEPPKYLNSPESPRFSKGKLLYGLDRAKESIRKSDTVLLVEGYFDQIACERAGLHNAVASMGTALTEAQADLLARHAGTVIVAYDGDAPGLTAAQKAFGLLITHGVKLAHLVLPDGHDPDSYLAAHGAEALRKEVEGALPLVGALARPVLEAKQDPAERASRVSAAVEILGKAPDGILRFELLSGLSRAVGIPLHVLAPGEGKKRRGGRVEQPGAAPEELGESERSVLAGLLASWPASAGLVERIPLDVFRHPAAQEIFAAMKSLGPDAPTLDFSSLGSHVGAGAEPVLARLLLQESDETDPPGHREGAQGPTQAPDEVRERARARSLERLHKPLLQLKIRHLEERGAALQPQILAAAGDAARQAKLLREKQILSAEAQRLKQELRRQPEPGDVRKGEAAGAAPPKR